MKMKDDDKLSQSRSACRVGSRLNTTNQLAVHFLRASPNTLGGCPLLRVQLPMGRLAGLA